MPPGQPLVFTVLSNCIFTNSCSALSCSALSYRAPLLFAAFACSRCCKQTYIFGMSQVWAYDHSDDEVLGTVVRTGRLHGLTTVYFTKSRHASHALCRSHTACTAMRLQAATFLNLLLPSQILFVTLHSSVWLFDTAFDSVKPMCKAKHSSTWHWLVVWPISGVWSVFP